MGSESKIIRESMMKNFVKSNHRKLIFYVPAFSFFIVNHCLIFFSCIFFLSLMTL